MLIDELMKRASSGLLTTTAGGGASAVVSNAKGVLLAVEVVLGTASAATVAISNDQGVTIMAAKAFSSSGQFCPGNTITDGTTPGSIPIPLFGDTTITITGGGNAKTVTVNLYYR